MAFQETTLHEVRLCINVSALVTTSMTLPPRPVRKLNKLVYSPRWILMRLLLALLLEPYLDV